MIRSNRVALLGAMSLGIILVLAACGPAPDTATPEPPADSPLPTPTDARAIRLTPGAKPLPEMVPQVTPAPATGEVPADLLAAIVADLAGSGDIASDQIEVVRAESVVWADGSLGCPEPGVSYLQVQTHGYRVVLAHGGQTFDYRATEDGYFRLCPHPGPVAPGSSGDIE
ncbi:MAG: hypothetical protein ACK2UY_17385 [Anaerolineae bacterium]